MNDDEGLWIRTEPTLDGKAFVVTLSIDQDFAVTLTPTRALAYASALLAAVADAEYDAAILGQLTGRRLGLAIATASQLIVDMRAERPTRTASGLTFVPGVSRRAQHPFIILEREGKSIAQLEVSSARRHAMHVLEAPTGADLDAAYLKVLRGQVGLDENVARSVVEDIVHHRVEWAVADE